jgi:hypothetical protein
MKEGVVSMADAMLLDERGCGGRLYQDAMENATKLPGLKWEGNVIAIIFFITRGDTRIAECHLRGGGRV